MSNATNHRQPKVAERGTSGTAFGCPSAFALLADILYSFKSGIFA